MVQYKVIYFDKRAVAEIIRQVLVVAEQDFEDVRYTPGEWSKHKADTPFGQLPVLEVDGKQLAQSFAIARFLARKFGLAGKNAFEEAFVDSIADQLSDYVAEIRPFYKAERGFGEGGLSTLLLDVFESARDKMFTIISKLMKSNESGYLIGDSLTWADLYLAEFAEFAKKVPFLYDGFPEVKAHSERVRSIPALKKWLAIRPQTAF